MLNHLGPPVQIAYAVNDVHAAAERFAATTGAGPFFVVEHIGITSARVHGEPGVFDHSSAYGQWGALMVELVQEHSAPLVPPDGRVHHLAFLVPDLTAAVTDCADRGWPDVLWAHTTAGQSFAFCDARTERGHLVELYEPTERLHAFYAMVATAADRWDGSRPVRPISAR